MCYAQHVIVLLELVRSIQRNWSSSNIGMKKQIQKVTHITLGCVGPSDIPILN